MCLQSGDCAHGLCVGPLERLLECLRAYLMGREALLIEPHHGFDWRPNDIQARRVERDRDHGEGKLLVLRRWERTGIEGDLLDGTLGSRRRRRDEYDDAESGY